MISISKEDQFRSWFKRIYEKHLERLYLYAFTITKDKQLAEDVVSEVFMTIWDKRPNPGDIHDVGAYLCVSVKHLAVRLASKDPGKFTYSTYDEAFQISDSIDPEKLLINSEMKTLIDSILMGLSPQAGIIYDMVRNQGMSHEEISEELSISAKTVSNQMNLILNRMRSGISNYLDDSNEFGTIMNVSRVISALFSCAFLLEL